MITAEYLGGVYVAMPVRPALGDRYDFLIRDGKHEAARRFCFQYLGGWRPGQLFNEHGRPVGHVDALLDALRLELRGIS